MAVRNRAGLKQTLKSQGSRAAYQHGPFYFELDLKTPRHGDRLFEVCHIDHALLDFELTGSTGEHVLGRPWMTLMIDAFSRRALAVYVDFDEPSYRSCVMVLRECVGLHNRLLVWPRNSSHASCPARSPTLMEFRPGAGCYCARVPR